MQAPNQAGVDIVDGKRLEPIGFVGGALVEVLNRIRQDADPFVVGKAFG